MNEKKITAEMAEFVNEYLEAKSLSRDFAHEVRDAIYHAIHNFPRDNYGADRAREAVDKDLLKDMGKEFGGVKCEIEEIEREVALDEIADLRKENQELWDKASDDRAAIDQLETDRADLTKQNQELRDRISELESEVESLKSELDGSSE